MTKNIPIVDETLPHQLKVTVDSAFVLHAGCNCGARFTTGRTLYGGILAGLFKDHMKEIEEGEEIPKPILSIVSDE
jgi:hypothetical protein